MSFRTWPLAGRLLGGALVGAAIALGVGLAVIWLLPDDGDGWADLGAAAFTTVIGIPVGAVLGALVGWWLGSVQEDGVSNSTSTSV